MKKLITAILTIALCIACTIPASAASCGTIPQTDGNVKSECGTIPQTDGDIKSECGIIPQTDPWVTALWISDLISSENWSCVTIPQTDGNAKSEYGIIPQVDEDLPLDIVLSYEWEPLEILPSEDKPLDILLSDEEPLTILPEGDLPLKIADPFSATDGDTGYLEVTGSEVCYHLGNNVYLVTNDFDGFLFVIKGTEQVEIFCTTASGNLLKGTLATSGKFFEVVVIASWQ